MSISGTTTAVRPGTGLARLLREKPAPRIALFHRRVGDFAGAVRRR
ncbi:hypothetical protein [Streptomyces sp. NPDC014995]